ncbi:MAG: hypothetical protein IT203_06985 [Fimbriimonadaceae bacterium]|nr:hypothetical protein [Fimbriimonadaceae bacterium]
MKRNHALVAIAILIQQILVAGAAAANSLTQSSGRVEGFVTPSNVNAKEPFTFTAQGVVEGEVIDIKTVEGQVVASRKTDKLGRVFLPTGLAAGAYLLTHGAKSSGHLEVVNPNSPPIPANNLSFQMPKFVDQNAGLNLTGTGFSGNAAEMKISSGKNIVPVLASTPRELRTGAMANLKPGFHKLSVGNLATGERVTGNDLVVYRVQSTLARKTLVSGESTVLEFNVEPRELQADIKANIISGPVHFAGGGNETHIAIKNGTGKAPLAADPAGTGKFNLIWEMSNIMVLMTPQGQNPGDPAQGESTEPCPATRHTMKPIGVWKPAGKRGDLFIATRERQCYVQECRFNKGHPGEHEYGAPKACPDKDRDTEEKTFDTEDARTKFIKESKAG